MIATSNRKGEKAVEIFNLVRAKGMLPQKIDDLVPLSFIGQAAVSFYRQTIKHLKDIPMAESQRKKTLKDGQEAGELLLDIEARIGEMLPPAEEALRTSEGSPLTSSKRVKRHEGITANRAHQARSIACHPDIVEKVKAQAKENEDIPTKTAVLNEIRHEKEKERKEKAEKNKTDSTVIIAIEQVQYINGLDRCLSILPTSPPKKWNQEALAEATGKARIIIKRLEVFKNGETHRSEEGEGATDRL